VRIRLYVDLTRFYLLLELLFWWKRRNKVRPHLPNMNERYLWRLMDLLAYLKFITFLWACLCHGLNAARSHAAKHKFSVKSINISFHFPRAACRHRIILDNFRWNRSKWVSSSRRSKELVAEGDTVILFLCISSQYPILVTKLIKNRNGELIENKFQTIYGVLDVISLVGQKYGTKVHLPRGWGYILRPTCELWTTNLPHRTQIIYTPDISMIITNLGVRPGSTVIEAGKRIKPKLS